VTVHEAIISQFKCLASEEGSTLVMHGVTEGVFLRIFKTINELFKAEVS
jgi:hypothetical protein